MAAEMSGKQERRQTKQLHASWEDTSLWKNPKKGVLSTDQAPYSGAKPSYVQMTSLTTL